MDNKPGPFVRLTQAIFNVFLIMGILYAIVSVCVISHKYILGIYNLEQRVEALEKMGDRDNGGH